MEKELLILPTKDCLLIKGKWIFNLKKIFFKGRLFVLRFHLCDRERETAREGTEAEGEASFSLSRELDAELHLRTLGS